MRKVIGLLFLYCLPILNALTHPIGRESVFVHMNTQTLISGETLYLSAYCNLISRQPSEISKVLYVEIVGENGPIHQQKIFLSNGRGHSEFFISSLVPSGKYYLLAYTRWMKNFDDYYKCPVWIINPFEKYPEIEDITEANIRFYPLHSPLVAGVENVIAYRLQAADPINYKGRIINDIGETVTTFNADHFGLGKFIFIPVKEQTYQVLLEDEKGNMMFFDLPEVTAKGSFITYKESEDQLIVKCDVVGENIDTLNLTVFANGLAKYQSSVMPNEQHIISKDVIQNGFYNVQYSSTEGNIVAQRNILCAPPILTNIRIGKTYGRRQKVQFNTNLISGNYSISVRKKFNQRFNYHQHAIWNGALEGVLNSPVPIAAYLSSPDRDIEAFLLASEIHCTTPAKINEVKFLPEVREELLLGFIEDSVGNPAVRQKVALTLPGNPFQLRIGESDEQGNFFIPYQSTGTDVEAILTAVDFHNKFKLSVQKVFLDRYPKFNFEMPKLNNEFINEITDKSIRVQIENAYISFSDKKPKHNWLVEIPYHYFYKLDEYRRFPTLRETFTEYIVTANVRPNRDFAIKTSYTSGLFKSDYPPLVLLDGVPVDGKEIIDYNPYKVESIGVLPNRYFIGAMAIDGLVSIETFNKNYGDFQFDFSGNHKKVPIIKATTNNTYEFPDYSSNSDKAHLPDQRDQLYWDPNFEPGLGKSEFCFYTSDVPGEYEIVIEGFTDNGIPMTKIFDFRVE